MVNAAGHLRSNETKCGSGNSHNYLFGIDGSVTGKHGFTALGDLSTVVCSYDSTAGYSSNSLSSYFHDIGWRQRANNLVQDWLLGDGMKDKHNVGGNSTLPQTLGGNYGEATPSDLKFDITASTTADKCSIDKDPWPTIYDNSLSALSAAEMVRRLTLHREVPQSMRYPGAQWKDIQVHIITCLLHISIFQ